MKKVYKYILNAESYTKYKFVCHENQNLDVKHCHIFKQIN